eukprot:1162060-Pelagomonas_calceolata.AAC.2
MQLTLASLLPAREGDSLLFNVFSLPEIVSVTHQDKCSLPAATNPQQPGPITDHVLSGQSQQQTDAVNDPSRHNGSQCWRVPVCDPEASVWPSHSQCQLIPHVALAQLPKTVSIPPYGPRTALNYSASVWSLHRFPRQCQRAAWDSAQDNASM